MEVFRGIPYAKPPVGDLRFRISEKLPRRQKISSSIYEKAACPQFGPYPFAAQQENQSEDCLHLSVYRPIGAGQGTVRRLFLCYIIQFRAHFPWKIIWALALPLAASAWV